MTLLASSDGRPESGWPTGRHHRKISEQVQPQFLFTACCGAVNFVCYGQHSNLKPSRMSHRSDFTAGQLQAADAGAQGKSPLACSLASFAFRSEARSSQVKSQNTINNTRQTVVTDWALLQCSQRRCEQPGSGRQHSSVTEPPKACPSPSIESLSRNPADWV